MCCCHCVRCFYTWVTTLSKALENFPVTHVDCPLSSIWVTLWQERKKGIEVTSTDWLVRFVERREWSIRHLHSISWRCFAYGFTPLGYLPIMIGSGRWLITVERSKRSRTWSNTSTNSRNLSPSIINSISPNARRNWSTWKPSSTNVFSLLRLRPWTSFVTTIRSSESLPAEIRTSVMAVQFSSRDRRAGEMALRGIATEHFETETNAGRSGNTNTNPWSRSTPSNHCSTNGECLSREEHLYLSIRQQTGSSDSPTSSGDLCSTHHSSLPLPQSISFPSRSTLSSHVKFCKRNASLVRLSLFLSLSLFLFQKQQRHFVRTKQHTRAHRLPVLLKKEATKKNSK